MAPTLHYIATVTRQGCKGSFGLITGQDFPTALTTATSAIMELVYCTHHTSTGDRQHKMVPTVHYIATVTLRGSKEALLDC